MPNYTTKLNLEKPLGNEFYNIEVHNSNSDKIDAFANEIELRKLNKTGDTADDLKVTKVPVDLLDTVRKQELNSMAGGEIKGYIEDGGSHVVGEIWLSRNVKGEFKCLVTNTDTYIDAAKWVQIDDLTNASKLNNLGVSLIQHGIKVCSNISVGSYEVINVQFAKPFTYPPTVIASIGTNVTGPTAGLYSDTEFLTVYNATETGVNFKWKNISQDQTNTRSIKWVAIGIYPYN